MLWIAWVALATGQVWCSGPFPAATAYRIAAAGVIPGAISATVGTTCKEKR